MKAERSEKASEESLEASKSWFMKFKERSRLYNREVQNEAARAAAGAAASYSEVLAKINNEGDYAKRVLNVSETALYWKKIPPNTFIAGEKSVWFRSFKGQADSCYRLTQLVTLS